MTMDERFAAAEKKFTANMTQDEQLETIVSTLCHQDIDNFGVWSQSKDQSLDRFVFRLSTGRKAQCAVVKLMETDPLNIFAEIQETENVDEIDTAMGRKQVLSGPVTEDEVLEISKQLCGLFGIVFQISWGGGATCADKLVSSHVQLLAPRFPPGTKIKRQSGERTIFAVVEATPCEGLLAGIGAWYCARHLKKNGTPGKRTDDLGSWLEWSEC